jgi:hypothetical protein
MNGITVLVATRERPRQALLTLKSFEETKVLPQSKIVFGIDANEPYHNSYRNMLLNHGGTLYRAEPEDSGSLTKVTNALATAYPDYILASVGDDHRFRTTGWDASIALALREKPGVAYGDDLYMRQALPTAAFVSGSIVSALGWMCLPTLDHMYVDNVWRDIGSELGSLHYLGNVVIEHLHYTNGKSIMDTSYQRTNSKAQFAKDLAAYEQWRTNQMAADIDSIRNYIGQKT